MKLTAYIIIALVASLLLITVQTATGQIEIVAGVKPGNQFTYSVTGSYSSNAPYNEVPEEVLNAQASEYFKITIVNVTNPTVGYKFVWHFTNGTETNGDGVTNLEIPSESIGPFWPMVSANLSVGQSIHPHFGPTSTFNESVLWTYTNYTRETNRLQTESKEQSNKTAVIKYRTVQSDAYFDKLTGMLVSLNDQTYYSNPTFTTSITWKLIGQTAWAFNSEGSYPPAPLFTIPVIIALAILVAFFVVIIGWVVSSRRTKARKKQLLNKK